MNTQSSRYALILLIALTTACSKSEPPKDQATTTRPTLSVTVIEPELRKLPQTLSANGSIMAWQEAIIGAEVSGLRLAAVNAQVGDKVHKGQVLALFADDSVQAEVAQSRALLAEAQAAHADASINADRARKISSSIALSAQQVGQYLTSEKTAEARVASAKAALDAQLVRLHHTKVLASDDGVISSRSATLGAVAAPGQELFRLIRQNRPRCFSDRAGCWHSNRQSPCFSAEFGFSEPQRFGVCRFTECRRARFKSWDVCAG
jgi:multidrug efflux pump subunit AcrA (membrane-fusion protein)